MMVRLTVLFAFVVAVVHGAVETVPIRENGMLRGPTETAAERDNGRRLMWSGWSFLLNHLCPPHAHHGPCRHSYSSSSGGGSSGSSGSSSSSGSSGSSSSSGSSGSSYQQDANGNTVDGNGNVVVQNYADGESGTATNRDGSTQAASRKTTAWWVAGAAMATTMIVGAAVWKRKKDQDEEQGLNHDLAGSIRKIVANGGASVFGSTIATDDVTTASPDFVSLDGSSGNQQEIEMEAPPPRRARYPKSRFAM